MTDKHEDIREFLNNLPDKYDIMEEGIDIQTQKEYIDYSHSFDSGELTEKDTLNLGNNLFDTSQPLETKKKVLTLCIKIYIIHLLAKVIIHKKN